jgi:hypothetical protein
MARLLVPVIALIAAAYKGLFAAAYTVSLGNCGDVGKIRRYAEPRTEVLK